MNIDTFIRENVLVATVAEARLDASVAIRFKDTMRKILSETSSDRVILDLGMVGFLDSSGLGAIVSIMKLLGAERRLELAALTENVAKVFRLTRMDTVIPILPAAPRHDRGPLM